MHDLFPEEQMRVNLVVLAYDVGITEDLAKAVTIDASLISRCSKRMVQGHGVSIENAEWSAAVWCVCYGGEILGKAVDSEVSIPDSMSLSYEKFNNQRTKPRLPNVGV